MHCKCNAYPTQKFWRCVQIQSYGLSHLRGNSWIETWRCLYRPYSRFMASPQTSIDLPGSVASGICHSPPATSSDLHNGDRNGSAVPLVFMLALACFRRAKQAKPCKNNFNLTSKAEKNRVLPCNESYSKSGAKQTKAAFSPENQFLKVAEWSE